MSTHNQSARFGLVLGIICLTATLVLAVTYEVTKPKIEEQARLENDAALRSLFPEASAFNLKSVDGIEYFEAMKGPNPAGYCVKVTGAGYGGFIRIIVGVDRSGIIKGVKILEHQETPGLGSKINEVNPGEKDPWFLKQFAGKPAKTIAVGKDIDAITGATISSSAVTDAIRDTVTGFLTKVKR